MLKHWKQFAAGGVLMVAACGAASAAIRNISGGAGIGGRADSLVFPWMDAYSSHGPEYFSASAFASVNGASANSEVRTSSTPDPDHLLEWSAVCGTFSGSGSASAGVAAPNGGMANAGAYVNLNFDSDGVFGISFKTTGVGRLTIVGAGGVTYADCGGDNEIIGFLPSGRYTLSAVVNAAVVAPYASGEYWPPGYPSGLGEGGSFQFTVPAPGWIAVAGICLLPTARRSRR